MKNAKDKFARLGQALLDEPAQPAAERPADKKETQPSVKTESQKAVKTSRSPVRPSSPAVRLAVAPTRTAPKMQNEQGSEAGEEPRRQMTVKLPLSLYAKLSDEKSRRVVANHKHWSIQDIITEALERHLRSN